jgi:hypothetical protein
MFTTKINCVKQVAYDISHKWQWILNKRKRQQNTSSSFNVLSFAIKMQLF